MRSRPDFQSMQGWTAHDQIDQLKSKLSLKDRDRQAYYEASQRAIAKNESLVLALHAGNKEQRVALAESQNRDGEVINQVFQERKTTRLAMLRNTAKKAIDLMDQKGCEDAKRYNAMQHQRSMCEQRLRDLQTLLDSMELAGSKGPKDIDQEQVIRQLENRIDKMRIRINTAKNIRHTYEEILHYLKEESLVFPEKLDAMELAIRAQDKELAELRSIQQDAQLSREAAKSDLQKQEQAHFEAKRMREQTLNEKKKQVEKQKEFAEKAEKRAQRATFHADDHAHDNPVPGLSITKSAELIQTYEEAFRLIKEATVVFDINDIVWQFQTQDGTTRHLEKQSRDAEQLRAKLREEKNRFTAEFSELKYSGEAVLSQNALLLEQMGDHLKQEEGRSSGALTRLERTQSVLTQATIGIHNLMDKLNAVKISVKKFPVPVSKMEVRDHLDVCEQKLLLLMKQVQLKVGPPGAERDKKMASSGFQAFLEGGLRQDNLRITVEKEESEYEETYEYESQEHEEALSRSDIKRLGDELLDVHRPKKKKTKKSKN
ncbi:outer dynein arm-docking complex subunit 3-like [Branchiostoma lanceolatum]|uniref:outer dynein arm-docking complex subunit 3-like n=1 Tax=Branchiostoma lanceolatum TaxID=7740 RepID=UPI0034515F1E